MTTGGSLLFRAEVARHRADRLHGSVSIATPLAWQVIGFLLLIALVVTVGFLSTATYSRVETVGGTVTLDKGVATLMPSRAGVIAALYVAEGQRVHAGEVLARVRSEEDMISGNTAPTRIRTALGKQDERLSAHGRLLFAASSEEQGRLREQIAGLTDEVASLDSQISDQRRLLDVAGADYDSVRRVADKGFISRRDMEARQATILSRHQQLAQLEQLRASKISAVAEARRAVAQSRASAEAQIASAESERAALAQQLAQADLASGYAITSPVEGVVTAMTARLGQPANNQQPLMMIVPAGALPRVELYVPTNAAGFIRPGQEVRLAIDAFPYQQFGTLPARIADVSATTVARQGPNGVTPVYLVTATLSQPWVRAFGRRQTLAPGMTLAARIVTENRSLIEWLFQPVFAVRNR